jgi:replicative DNA helicase
MDWLGQQALKSIEDDSNQIVIKVTWEQSVEEDTLGWLASQSGVSLTRMVQGDINEDEWIIVKTMAMRRSTTPLWIIGHSSQDSGEKRRARPRMTMTDVGRALEHILNERTAPNTTVKALILDYLQRIRPDPQDGRDRRLQVSEIVNRAKDAGLSFSCPVFLGVQSSREVLDRKDKIPRIDDCLESSAIEQTADKVFSLWYPIKTNEEGSELGKTGYVVTKNLLVVRLLKQKMGPAPETFPLYVDPETRFLSAMGKEYGGEP